MSKMSDFELWRFDNSIEPEAPITNYMIDCWKNHGEWTELSDETYMKWHKMFYSDGVDVIFTEDNEVNHPRHYQDSSIECIDAMRIAFGEDAVLYFCICNAYKYLWRCAYKNEYIKDLEKAKWYIGYASDLLNGDVRYRTQKDAVHQVGIISQMINKKMEEFE